MDDLRGGGGCHERVDRGPGSARDDDDRACGTVDQAARYAAEQHAPERPMAARAADEHVDVLAEFREGRDCAADQRLGGRAAGWHDSVERAADTVPGVARDLLD